MTKDWHDLIFVVNLSGKHYVVDMWTADGSKVPHHYIDDVFGGYEEACSEAIRRAKESKGFAFCDCSGTLSEGAILGCLWPKFNRDEAKP